MPRVPYLEAQDSPQIKEFFELLSVERKGHGITRGEHTWQLYSTLLHNPDFAMGWLNLLSVVRNKSTLPNAEQELIIVLLNIINNDKFQFESHAPKALKCGFTQEQIDDLSDWQNSNRFNGRQRAILAYADMITRSVQVSEDVFAEVKAQFNDREIVDLTALVATYNLVARFIVPLQIGM